MSGLTTFPTGVCAARGSLGCNRMHDGRLYCNAACEAEGPKPKSQVRSKRMAKELRIDVRVPIPDDLFEGADVLAKIKPVFEVLNKHVAEFGDVVSHDVVTPRAKGSDAS